MANEEATTKTDQEENDRTTTNRSLMQRLGLSSGSSNSQATTESSSSTSGGSWLLPSAVRRNVTDLTRSCIGRGRRRPSRHEADVLRERSDTSRQRPASVKRKSRDLKQVEDDVENDSLERSSPVPTCSRRSIVDADPVLVLSRGGESAHFEDIDINRMAVVAARGGDLLPHRPSPNLHQPAAAAPSSSAVSFETAVLNFFSNVTSHRGPLSTLVNNSSSPAAAAVTAAVHSQIDCENFLIPNQREIINCPFYWGKIDRYEAEELLSDKPEGSFLLRDSAQDDFVFSVSFRRYSRSLHARIEEEDHLFSFDSHDPGVHCSQTIRQLLEHYKDPLSCMFFEPMLLFPVIRKTCFSLQSLTRAAIVDSMTGVRCNGGSGSDEGAANPAPPDSRAYAGISELPLPKVLKQYLREYHYKHKIRTRYIEVN